MNRIVALAVELVDRYKFSRRVKNYDRDGVKTFDYDKKTGRGIAFDRYDFLLDVVTVRYSTTGYVTGEGEWSRYRWEAHVKSLNRDWIKL